MKKIIVKQHDITDCGAACLSSVIRYFGLSESISRIRQFAGTGQKGTNLKGMMEAAGKLGMDSRAVRVEKELLGEVPFPAIAHLHIEKAWYHFVVVYAVAGNKVKIMDPAKGRLEYRKISEFKNEWTGVMLLLSPSERFVPGQSTRSVWNRFLSLLSPHRHALLHALLGACVYSILGISTSLYVETLIDRIIPSGNTVLLNRFSALLLLIILIRVYIGYVKNLLIIKSGQKIDATLIVGYFRHLMKLPGQFFRSMRTGEIISRVNDAMKIRSFINNMALELSVDSMILVITMSFMLSYSIRLAVLILLAIPVYVLIYLIYNHYNKIFLRKTMEYSADLEAGFVESIKAYTSIQTCPSSEFFNIRMEERCLKLLRTGYKVSRNANFTFHSTDLLANIMVVAILWSGSGLIFRGQLTTGELLSFFTLFSYISRPLNSLINANRSVQDAAIAADRLFQIMDLELNESKEEVVSFPEQLKSFNIILKKVHFNYPGQPELFKKLNLELKSGEITAIVGENGSGKSTLLNLIQKLERPVSGEIYYDDLDLRHISRDDLNQITGFVPQQAFLFNGSFLENIALGSFDPDPLKVKRLCKQAGLDETLNKLPSGLLTQISEEGNNFSGGEKQKISFARGMYHDPQVLILDEPTSSMDKPSAEKIIKVLEELRDQGRLIIMVTHNSNLAMRADRVVFLSGGQAEMTGSHEYLSANSENYRNFWAESN